jgi:DNA-binding transcriptional ArsR family regulator
MRNDKRIGPETLRLIAAKLSVLADESRLAILNELRGGERTVTMLMEATGLSQPNISKHLRLLRQEKFVTFRKAGPHSFYRICDPVVFQLCDLLCRALRTELEKKSGEG